MPKKYPYLFWLLPAFLIHGCTTTDHAAGIDIDTIKEIVDPDFRYSGDWGNIEQQEKGCIDISGIYAIVPVFRVDDPDGKSGISLSNLLNLQSHNWPLKHPLAEDKYVQIKSHNYNSPIDFIFQVEVVPFQSKLNTYQCTNGWTRVHYEEESPGEAVWINSINDVYLSKTVDGDLIVFHQSWSKTTALFGLNKHEMSHEKWYLFESLGKH